MFGKFLNQLWQNCNVFGAALLYNVHGQIKYPSGHTGCQPQQKSKIIRAKRVLHAAGQFKRFIILRCLWSWHCKLELNKTFDLGLMSFANVSIVMHSN